MPVRTLGADVLLFTVEVTQPRNVYPLGAPAAGRVMELPSLTVWLATALTPKGTEKETVYVVTTGSGSGSLPPEEGEGDVA